MLNINTKFWQHNKLIHKQNKYFGNTISVTRGVRQGDIMSPTLFTIMIDSVILHYEETARLEDKTSVQFYADNGFISAVNETVAQHTLNIYTTTRFPTI
jgi:retron-type reverse transcriptase